MSVDIHALEPPIYPFFGKHLVEAVAQGTVIGAIVSFAEIFGIPVDRKSISEDIVGKNRAVVGNDCAPLGLYLSHHAQFLFGTFVPFRTLDKHGDGQLVNTSYYNNKRTSNDKRVARHNSRFTLFLHNRGYLMLFEDIGWLFGHFEPEMEGIDFLKHKFLANLGVVFACRFNQFRLAIV